MVRVFKLQILNSGKQVWMLPLTKLIRTVGGGFRREKMVQTVTWLSGHERVCDLTCQ